jgi:hypothetical protein
LPASVLTVGRAVCLKQEASVAMAALAGWGSRGG